MYTQRCFIFVIFAGISLLLTAPSHADSAGGDIGAQGSVAVTGSAGEVQGLVGVAARGALSLPHIHECLDIILAVPGCLKEIISSFVSLQPKLLGPQCCNAVLQINGSCLPKLSSKLNTDFPFTLIKNFCAARVGSPPAAPPPPCKKHHRCKKQDDEA